MNAVDTNVLVYVRDPRDPAKQRMANDVVNALEDGVLLWQVACEYIAATRKLAKIGHTHDTAIDDIADMRLIWRVVLPSWPVFERATHLVAAHSVSFFDALIVGACLEAGVSTIYSEDIRQHPAFAPLKVINPFA